ncbi:MAG: DUF2845 domain-containing protein [Desulfobacterales bacterium]|nr:DUF2845 domain-containing protein [Desulfobacterales bacterium]
MRYLHIFLTAIILLSLFSPANAGIRCGNDIISTGETKVEVLVKLKSCGEILEKDAYIKESTYKKGSDEITSQVKVDQWQIRIKERGSHYCYPITFEDGELTTIGRWSRCD